MSIEKINFGKLFKPKTSFFEAEHFLENKVELKLCNDSAFKLIKKLVASAWPSQQDKFDKRWCCFYLPLKKSSRLVSLPFSIMEYKKNFYLCFQRLGYICIAKGKEKIEEFYTKILQETIRFNKLIKNTEGEIVRKTLPYDIRTGKIKGKYVLKELMPEKEKQKILSGYKKHLEKKLRVSGISLNDYLHVAGICYKTAYGNKTNGLSDEAMYKKWADSRHAGMLDIKNKNSKKEFSQWYAQGAYSGGHPFEIVFSWLGLGIHLYPPRKDRLCFLLCPSRHGYALAFIKMTKVLIRKVIAFEALELEKILEYLSGESYFTVNDYSEHWLFYIPCKEDKKNYFKYIEWDPIEIPNFKQ